MRDYGRLSRNPISLLLFIALAEVGVAQLVSGPEGSVVILSLAPVAQIAFAWALLISALLVLLGAAMPEPRAYWLEAGGKAGCAVTLGVYTVTLPDAISSWATGLGLVFGAVAIACLLRITWLTRLIVFNFYPRLYRRLGRTTLRVRSIVRGRR